MQGLVELGAAYNGAGQLDSAIAVYERWLAVPSTDRVGIDWLWLAPTYQRLAQLYNARVDRDHALRCYAQFVALWKDADEALQPKVAQAKKRMAQLSARKS